MQIQFFEDIFCDLESTDNNTLYKCKNCMTTYKTSKPDLKIPCLNKLSKNNILIDNTYQVESVFRHNKPSFLIKIQNFLTALYKHMMSGARRTSAQERHRRYDICSSCEFFDGSACTKCGCPISRQARFISKLDWADQHCPIDKW